MLFYGQNFCFHATIACSILEDYIWARHATWRLQHSFFHGLILCLCLRYLDLDLWKSVRFILLENRWGFHQADALLQLLYCLSHQLGLLSLLSASCFQLHVKWYSSSSLYIYLRKNDEKNQLPCLNMFGLPPWSDFINCLNGLQSVFCEIPVIPLWPITLPLKLKGRILQYMEAGNRKIDKHSIFSY